MFPQLFGKYVLERELASGGMAIVYLATLRGAGGFEKRLVVKQIRVELASDRAFVERFVAEAKTTVGLSHPNIVPVYELGVEQGVYFIAMELALGVTLGDLVAASGPLSPTEGAHIGVEICRALDYAHRKAGVVHRDVTPRNVLVDEEGHVRLIDFGIAAPVSTPGAAREHVFGSPGHMPPEQIRGGTLSPATDVFAVAALLVEAWTGRAPFRRATREESEEALGGARRPLAETTPELAPLDDLFARALSAEPGERPPTAEDLARPLRDFLRAADLGDLARRLGERVRKARRSPSLADLASPPLSAGGRTPRTPVMHGPSTGEGTRPLEQTAGPLRPSGEGPVTATFAAHDAVQEWTRGASQPPPARAPQAPDSAPQATAVRAPKGHQGGLFGRRLLWAALLSAGVALLVFGRRGERGAGDGTTGPGDPEAPGSALFGPGASPAAEGRTVASPPSAVPQVAPRVAAPATPAAAAPPAGPAPRPSRAAEASGAGTLAITSDLPARVSVDGLSLGTTPLRTSKPGGVHAVTLTSASLDETLTARVVVSAGQTVTIHGEFTRPVPTLRVR